MLAREIGETAGKISGNNFIQCLKSWACLSPFIVRNIIPDTETYNYEVTKKHAEKT